MNTPYMQWKERFGHPEKCNDKTNDYIQQIIPAPTGMVCGRHFSIAENKSAYGMWVLPVVALAVRFDSHCLQNITPIICDFDGSIDEADCVSNAYVTYPSLRALLQSVAMNNAERPTLKCVELLGMGELASKLADCEWPQRPIEGDDE